MPYTSVLLTNVLMFTRVIDGFFFRDLLVPAQRCPPGSSSREVMLIDLFESKASCFGNQQVHKD